MESADITLPIRLRPAWVAPGVFAVLTLVMFGDVLFGPGGRVLSHASTDLALQFIPWREFGFNELKRGNLALWNPHIFCGAPYFAGFQAALLYPPNWLHLLLPLGAAINWIIALHVFAAGYFTYLWARGRAISIAGSILAGAMFMFGGPYFLHIYAGHLPHVAVMVWAPLILLAIDGLARDGSLKWTLVGALAVAMQVLAGHPQYVYYTGIAAGSYALLNLLTAHRKGVLIARFMVIYVGGAMLSAIQLLPGIDVQSELVRSGGAGYEFASTFSLPPQNLITLLAPNFFGWLPTTTPRDLLAESYWGAGYLWEMSLFVGVTGLVLSIVGLAWARGRGRWILIAMVVLTLLLALGRHTPLYRPMFEWLPYYGSFRGTVKFAYLAMLFVSLLAGVGFDQLLRRKRVSLVLPSIVLGFAMLLALFGWSISRSPQWWTEAIVAMARQAHDARELFTRSVSQFDDPSQIASTRATAARATLIAAATVAVAGCILLAARWRRNAVYLLLLLAMVELFVYARSTRATMPLTRGFPPDDKDAAKQIYAAWTDALAKLPPDHRAFNAASQLANASMSLGYNDIWGYDPGVLKRYAQLMAMMQGLAPEQSSQYLPFPPRLVPNVLQMLRCALVLVPRADQPTLGIPGALPTLTVISDWVQTSGIASAGAYMKQPTFDPHRTIVLEHPPALKTVPAARSPGSATVVAADTDWLEINAQLDRPGLLLITNAYSKDWKPTRLSAGAQAGYQIVPANWALQAIPLESGEHHLRIEYLPRAFTIGKWISIMSILAYVAIASRVLFMSRRAGFR